jgi:hypothetical protein
MGKLTRKMGIELRTPNRNGTASGFNQQERGFQPALVVAQGHGYSKNGLIKQRWYE